MAKKSTFPLKIGFEVILSIVVLSTLFVFHQKHLEKAESVEEPQVVNADPIPLPQANALSDLQNILVDSGLKAEYTIATLPPNLPEEIEIFDQSKIDSTEVKEYEAGVEYYMLFLHPGEKDFDQFGFFQLQQAEDLGWDITMDAFAMNGTKIVYAGEKIEVRATSIIREDKETGEPYVKEKIKLLILK